MIPHELLEQLSSRGASGFIPTMERFAWILKIKQTRFSDEIKKIPNLNSQDPTSVYINGLIRLTNKVLAGKPHFIRTYEHFLRTITTFFYTDLISSLLSQVENSHLIDPRLLSFIHSELQISNLPQVLVCIDRLRKVAVSNEGSDTECSTFPISILSNEGKDGSSHNPYMHSLELILHAYFIRQAIEKFGTEASISFEKSDSNFSIKHTPNTMLGNIPSIANALAATLFTREIAFNSVANLNSISRLIAKFIATECSRRIRILALYHSVPNAHDFSANIEELKALATMSCTGAPSAQQAAQAFISGSAPNFPIRGPFVFLAKLPDASEVITRITEKDRQNMPNPAPLLRLSLAYNLTHSANRHDFFGAINTTISQAVTQLFDTAQDRKDGIAPEMGLLQSTLRNEGVLNSVDLYMQAIFHAAIAIFNNIRSTSGFEKSLLDTISLILLTGICNINPSSLNPVFPDIQRIVKPEKATEIMTDINLKYQEAKHAPRLACGAWLRMFCEKAANCVRAVAAKPRVQVQKCN